MPNAKQTKAKQRGMAERAQEILGRVFPNVPEQCLWHRSRNKGYCTLPRTLPLAMQAIDARSKGHPAGHTLFCLWVRSPDNPLVTIENPTIFAAEAGFSGRRATDTWRRRMKQLASLNFIKHEPGPSGEFHYVLLLNPNVAVEEMSKKGLVQKNLYNHFIERLSEIGGLQDIKEIEKLCINAQNNEQQDRVTPTVNPDCFNQKAEA
ncbi:MAG: hypothetical protein LBG78_04630 [Azoarcus sp.]|jgi:hypothetical protein|nr:hypothetical protein [Azoarcus sp.]